MMVMEEGMARVVWGPIRLAKTIDRIKENCHTLTRTLIHPMRLNPSLRRLALLASALLTVLAPAAHAVVAPSGPTITTQPASATLAPGKTATFTVKATG